jgi:hypothetical protein
MPTTTVVGAPSNKAVVLLDSGSSFTYVLYPGRVRDFVLSLFSYAPKAICDAIYSNVTGAQYDASLGQWVVPCGYEIDMALQIGWVVFFLD